jgi:hypothetical protein
MTKTAETPEDVAAEIRRLIGVYPSWAAGSIDPDRIDDPLVRARLVAFELMDRGNAQAFKDAARLLKMAERVRGGAFATAG